MIMYTNSNYPQHWKKFSEFFYSKFSIPEFLIWKYWILGRCCLVDVFYCFTIKGRWTRQKHITKNTLWKIKLPILFHFIRACYTLFMFYINIMTMSSSFIITIIQHNLQHQARHSPVTRCRIDNRSYQQALQEQCSSNFQLMRVEISYRNWNVTIHDPWEAEGWNIKEESEGEKCRKKL